MLDLAVLIVSTVADVATDTVVQSLTARGIPHRRLNTEDLPFERAFTIEYRADQPCSIAFNAFGITPTAIWYRRLRSPPRPEAMDSGIYDFCLRECRAALLGGLLSQRTRWMSHPTAVWQAEFKPYQLQMAQEVGLQIPRTIVSNDPKAIRDAYSEFGPLIVKASGSGHFWEGAKEFSIFTSRLTEEHLDALEEARWSPSIYQALVQKRLDIRVTCVGRQLFAAAIHSQTDSAAVIDWRKTANPDLPHSSITLPSTLAEQLQRLMQRLGLQFGCIDLVLTPSNEYVFLEINPNGQWLWLDDQLDLGISEAVAEWLSGGQT